MYNWVVVSNIFLCLPLFGEMIQFDFHIFQMGWFNHQLDEICQLQSGFLVSMIGIDMEFIAGQNNDDFII